jgi:galactan 5-O-arabinofuranosyltransferase
VTATATDTASAPDDAGRWASVSAVGALPVAAVVGGLVSLVGLEVIGAVDWPAYNSSNVARSLTTLGQVVSIAFLVVAALLYRYGRSSFGQLLASTIGISGLVTVTLGMPLGATRLYLFGLSVDQQFRTEYLTRLTDSPRLSDMTYADLPPYYPAGWFWWGGRFAAARGLDGWEAYKPWAIISMAVAAAVAVVLWNRMVGTDKGSALALAVTVATLMYASPEPYSAVLILLGVPLLITMLYALRGRSRLAGGVVGDLRGTSWAAVAASGLFLGLCAAFYTLYAGLFALVACLMALYLVVSGWVAAKNVSRPDAEVRAARRNVVVTVGVRLLAMAAVSGITALTVWTPYLLDRLSGDAAGSGTATHYLPERGSWLPMPMFEWSLLGALTMAGFVWLVLRFRTRTTAMALGIAVVAVYLFCLLSMAATAAGTTLLAFRLEPMLVAILSAAGVFAAAELAAQAVRRFGDVRTVIGALAVAAAVTVAQGIPGHLSTDITIAYTDTDGTGQRADKRPAGAESYFPRINELIAEQTGTPARETIVLTADYGFLSVFPYRGFQGLTSHYANPLAEFDKRAATIATWAESSTPDELIGHLDTSPWPPPTVFLFRHSDDGYTLRLARDVYPNDPNVERYTVTFDPAAFADNRFQITTVGPFVLVVRQ